MPNSQHLDSTTNDTLEDAIPQNDKPPSCQITINNVNEVTTETADQPETTSITEISIKSSQTPLPDYNQAVQIQQNPPSLAATCSTRPPRYTLNDDPSYIDGIQRQTASGTNPYDNVFSIENVFIQREQALQQRRSASNNNDNRIYLNNAQGDNPIILNCTIPCWQFIVVVLLIYAVILLFFAAITRNNIS